MPNGNKRALSGGIQNVTHMIQKWKLVRGYQPDSRHWGIKDN